MKNPKYKILFILLLVLCFIFLFSQNTFGQDLWNKIKPPRPPGMPMAEPGKEPGQIIANVVLWIMGFIGAMAIGFIVYGAIRYVTSAGNEKIIEEAKRIILYAVIGFVIAILAVVIIQIVGKVAAGYPCSEEYPDRECIVIDPAKAPPDNECGENDANAMGYTCFWEKRCKGNKDWCCGEDPCFRCCKKK